MDTHPVGQREARLTERQPAAVPPGARPHLPSKAVSSRFGGRPGWRPRPPPRLTGAEGEVRTMTMVRLAIARRDALLVQLLEGGRGLAHHRCAAKSERWQQSNTAPVSCARGPRFAPIRRSPERNAPTSHQPTLDACRRRAACEASPRGQVFCYSRPSDETHAISGSTSRWTAAVRAAAGRAGLRAKR